MWRSVHQWAESRGDSPAIRDTVGTELTYAQLWNGAVALSCQLQRCAAAGDNVQLRPVAVLISECCPLALVELAVMVAGQGLTLCPLDATDPRLHLVLPDLEPVLVVCSRSEDVSAVQHICEPAPVVAWSSLREICETAQLESTVAQPGWTPPDEHEPCHIFYTSGSSGRPKGCIVSHRALHAYGCAKNSAHSIAQTDILLCASAHTFDPWLGDLASAMLAGALLLLPSQAHVLGSLPSLVTQHSATVLLTTPRLLAAWEPADFGSSLRVVAYGGEAMSEALTAAWLGHSAAAGCALYNMYGLTEVCVYQSSRRVTQLQDRLQLGEGLGDTQLRLVHPRTLEAGEGKGELVMSSAQLGEGYLKRPAMTQMCFITLPGGQRGFRTGDYFKQEGGGLRFAGRKDNQIKLQGRRVDLLEIEANLIRACAVQQLAVVVASGELTVCVVTEEDEALFTDVLLHLAKQRLPFYMVPSRVCCAVRDFPMRNGKLWRAELIASLPAPDESEEPDTEWNDSEMVVSAAWNTVLGVRATSRTDHFLRLGGDSLAALRVCAILVEASGLAESDPFGLKWPVKPADLLARPVLRSFAEHVQQLGLVTSGDSAPAEQSAAAGLPTTAAALLHRAAVLGSTDALRLVQPGLAADQLSDSLNRALLGAAANGHLGASVLLLEMKASPHSANPHGASVLHLAAGAAQTPQLVKSLLDASANSASTDRDKQIPLHYAARLGACNQALEALLKPNVCRGQRARTQALSMIDQRDGWGRTPLFWAAINGIRPGVTLLLSEGADDSIVDSHGETAKDAAHRRAQCSAQDRKVGLGSSVYGDIATLLGGSGKTKSFKK